MDVWEYIKLENIELPSLYFSHQRDCIIRDNVILNTAAALVICEKVNSIKEGIKLAEYKIDSGIAQKKLKSLLG